MSEFIFKDEGYKILGACFEVYKEKGCGFHEGIYQESLAIEFELQGIPFVEQPQIPVFYKGRQLKKCFVPDFICYDEIIVELKALSQLVDEHRSQVLNYLKATSKPVGYLINFGHHPKILHERMIRT
jgi:GxxExxY protein